MEPDISILRKTGHFYFALTRMELTRMELTNGTEVRSWNVDPMPDAETGHHVGVA
jgi:hypothetical protein